MASKWPPVKNAGFTFRVYLFAQSDNQIKTSPTLAAGDFQVSTDGGAFANLGTTPSESPASSGQVLVTLTAAEMNGDEVTVRAIDASGAEWHSAAWVIHTVGQTLDTIDGNVDSILTDTAEIGAAGAGLTAVPWNAAWDAEVQSEATDALNAYDPPTKAELDAGLAALNDPTAASVADAVWDEVITGAQHNVNNSAAKFLRESSEAITGVTGTMQAGSTSTTAVLASGAVSVDDIFNGERITIIEGTGAGQSRLISDSVASSDTVTVRKAWVTTPDATSVYAIVGAETELRAIADQGVSATATVDFDDLDSILTDTNELQTNQGNWLTATGFSTHSAADVWAVATRVLTANTNLNDPTAAAIADAILDELTSGHTTAGTVGKALTDILADTNELQTNQGNWATADVSGLATAAALATVDGNVDSILTDTGTTIPAQISALNNLSAAQVNAEVDTALADYDAPTKAELDAGLAALNDITAADVLAAINAATIDGTITRIQKERIELAVLAGKSTGGGTSTVTFRNQADDAARVTATVDNDGNRTAVTLDGS